MSTAKSVLGQALQLPRGERADIARELIASLDGDADADVDNAWLEEAERRRREASEDPTLLEDWTTVRERIAARLRGTRP
jgi:Putative addiction module component